MNQTDEPSAQPIRLDQFLKLSFITESGGQAKLLIQSGEISVNGEVETRRRRKLALGDVIQFEGRRFLVDDFLTTD